MILTQSPYSQPLRSSSNSFFCGSARLKSDLTRFKKTPDHLDRKVIQARPDLKANPAKMVNLGQKAIPAQLDQKATPAHLDRKANPAKTVAPAIKVNKAKRATPDLKENPARVALHQRTVGAGQNSRSNGQTASGVTRLIFAARQVAAAGLSASHNRAQPPIRLPQNGSPMSGMLCLKSGFTRTLAQRSYPSAGYLGIAAACWTRSHSLTGPERKPAFGHSPTAAGFCPA